MGEGGSQIPIASGEKGDSPLPQAGKMGTVMSVGKRRTAGLGNVLVAIHEIGDAESLEDGFDGLSFLERPGSY